MMKQFLQETISTLHELDLGQHTLFILSDNSINLVASDEHTSCLTDGMMHLDSEETYRLFISLHEQFQPQRKQQKDEITYDDEREEPTETTPFHRMKTEVITAQ